MYIYRSLTTPLFHIRFQETQRIISKYRSLTARKLCARSENNKVINIQNELERDHPARALRESRAGLLKRTLIDTARAAAARTQKPLSIFSLTRSNKISSYAFACFAWAPLSNKNAERDKKAALSNSFHPPTRERERERGVD